MRKRIVPLPAVLVLLMPAAYAGINRPPAAIPPREVTVTLVARAADLGAEIVNFGLPMPPGFLNDAGMVRVYGAGDTEVEAAVRSLEPWRIDGKDGTIRSLQIQFRADFRGQSRQQVKITFDKPRTKTSGRFVPVAETLIAPEGLHGPRVLALIPAKWLCDSWVVGPQVPASESGPYTSYDRHVETLLSKTGQTRSAAC